MSENSFFTDPQTPWNEFQVSETQQFDTRGSKTTKAKPFETFFKKIRQFYSKKIEQKKQTQNRQNSQSTYGVIIMVSPAKICRREIEKSELEIKTKFLS